MDYLLPEFQKKMAPDPVFRWFSVPSTGKGNGSREGSEERQHLIMSFDWPASFWCEHCGQNIIRLIRFLNWTDDPTEEDKAEPLAYVKRLHDQELHIYCGSCHKNKPREAFKESLPVWDGREMLEICDACFTKNRG